MLAQVNHGDSAPHKGPFHNTTAHYTNWVRVSIDQVPGVYSVTLLLSLRVMSMGDDLKVSRICGLL